MIAITCEKCRRRFTPTAEEIQGFLAGSQGKKHVLVLCPHCGKGNKVSAQRLQQSAPVSPPTGKGAASRGPGAQRLSPAAPDPLDTAGAPPPSESSTPYGSDEEQNQAA